MSREYGICEDNEKSMKWLSPSMGKLMYWGESEWIRSRTPDLEWFLCKHILLIHLRMSWSSKHGPLTL